MIEVTPEEIIAENEETVRVGLQKYISLEVAAERFLKMRRFIRENSDQFISREALLLLLCDVDTVLKETNHD